MPFQSFASKLDSRRVGPLKNGRLERWLVDPEVPIEEAYDRILAVMERRGFSSRVTVPAKKSAEEMLEELEKELSEE